MLKHIRLCVSGGVYTELKWFMCCTTHNFFYIRINLSVSMVMDQCCFDCIGSLIVNLQRPRFGNVLGFSRLSWPKSCHVHHKSWAWRFIEPQFPKKTECVVHTTREYKSCDKTAECLSSLILSNPEVNLQDILSIFSWFSLISLSKNGQLLLFMCC